jgi:hypothetical protein
MGQMPAPFSAVQNAADASQREKYTRAVKIARAVGRDYFERFPEDRYETCVEHSRHPRCDNYEFTMKRLPERKANPEWPPLENVPAAHFPTNVS